MRDEVSAAVLFLARLIEKSENFNRGQVEDFKERLQELLLERFQNHWFPEKPDRGQGYRCIRVNGVSRREPTLEKAAIACGIRYEDLNLPFELTIWVDPNEVCCRFGEQKGSFCTLASFSDKESSREFNTSHGNMCVSSGSEEDMLLASSSSASSLSSSPQQSPPFSPTKKQHSTPQQLREAMGGGFNGHLRRRWSSSSSTSSTSSVGSNSGGGPSRRGSGVASQQGTAGGASSVSKARRPLNLNLSCRTQQQQQQQQLQATQLLSPNKNSLSGQQLDQQGWLPYPWSSPPAATYLLQSVAQNKWHQSARYLPPNSTVKA